MDGMMGYSWMMLGTSLICLLLVLALLLGIAAFTKYLFFDRTR